MIFGALVMGVKLLYGQEVNGKGNTVRNLMIYRRVNLVFALRQQRIIESFVIGEAGVCSERTAQLTYLGL